MTSDATLLQRYADDHDAEAFAELARRYGRLVYGTCLRVTGCPHAAEDVAQDCFLALMRNAGRIRGVLPAWLHATATNRARNYLRSSSRRRTHEGKLAMPPAENEESPWAEIAPHVDRAIASLSEKLRLPLTLQFLQQRTQADIAAELGVSQPTVCRRIEKGLATLRARLRKAGVVASLALLISLLTERTAVAMPETVSIALGKMAMTGIGPSTGTGVATAATFKAQILMAGAVAAAVASTIAFWPQDEALPATPTANTPLVVPSTPEEGSRRTMTERDYSDLQLKGRGQSQDHFSLSIQAAMRLMDNPVDYKTVHLLSTNSFAPGLWAGEDCMAWWQHSGRGQSLGLVAARLGFNADLLSFPPEKQDDDHAGHNRACVPAIRQALDGGLIVATEGGWENGTGPWIANEWQYAPRWCYWGILTEARADGTILGATLNGRLDNPIMHAYPSYGLAPTDPALTARAADLAVLRRIIHRIRADAAPYAPEPGGVSYGLAAMDLWIARMEQVPFCGACGMGKSLGCAYETGSNLLIGARDSAGYLRDMAARMPAACLPHLDAAAAHYDRILALMKPAVTGWKSKEHYKYFIDLDLERQKAHADVLRECKTELAAVAVAVENALAAVRPVIQREGDRIVLEGVTTPCDGHLNSVMAATAALAQTLGVDATYDFLMGVSGTAFRFQIHNVNPCPSSPHAHVGFETGQAAFDALPWQTRHYSGEQQDALRAAVKASLEKGLPVMAGTEECGLIVGQEGAGDDAVLLWRTGMGAHFIGKERDKNGIRRSAPGMKVWGADVIEGDRPMPDRRTAVRRSLEVAVEMSETAVDPDGKYIRGPGGYKQWKNYLADWASVVVDGHDQELTIGNAFIYRSLIQYRRCAARYLRQYGPLLGPEAQIHLQRAADLYAQMADRLEKDAHNAPWPWEMKNPGKEWTDEMRQAEIQAIEEAQALDAQAIEAIRQALAVAAQ